MPSSLEDSLQTRGEVISASYLPVRYGHVIMCQLYMGFKDSDSGSHTVWQVLHLLTHHLLSLSDAFSLRLHSAVLLSVVDRRLNMAGKMVSHEDCIIVGEINIKGRRI